MCQNMEGGGKGKEDINATDPDWLALGFQRLPLLTEWSLLSIYLNCIIQTHDIKAGCFAASTSLLFNLGLNRLNF